MTALIIGTILAVGALAYVLYPLFFGTTRRPPYRVAKTKERDGVTRMRDDALSAEANADDEIEAALRAYRASHASCPDCGPRPESDAAFCSNCGRYLHDRCASCGAPVDARDARYCVNCGDQLKA
jgi:hypothetical protein